MLYLTALQEGLLYGLLALGVFISLRILNIPDLTTEGSFGFGNAAAALFASMGMPFLSLPAAMAAGIIAGLVTGLLQTKLKVHPVLSGIITMSGLYSVNLIVRGGPNLAVSDNSIFKIIYSMIGDLSRDEKRIAGAVVALAVAVVFVVLMILFFKTHVGMCIRATGDNADMVRASSINVDLTKIVGLCTANALTALSGALIAHYVGYSDSSSSNGALIYGLAAVIIGEAIFGKRGVTIGLVSAVCGSVIYKMIVTFVVDAELFGENSATLMKLMCAVIVAVTLAIPAVRENMAEYRNRKGAEAR